LSNEENVDDVLTVLGEPVVGGIMASALLLTVAISAASSTQTTILPTARGTLAMAVYGAIPKKFAEVHPRFHTPSFGTLVMGATAIFFYLVLSLVSVNTLADSIASLGLAVAFYYGITGYASVWYFRRTLFENARNFFLRGLLPLLGAIGMTWAFVISARDMYAADYGYTAFGDIGGVFVIGVGMLALGVPLMLACAVKLRPFFRGETLTAETPILVPDTGEAPLGSLQKTGE
jgi:amino acid transporter